MYVFIAIAIGAFVVVAGSFLFGHDHDTDHGDVGHDLGADADPTVSFFSPKSLGTLVMGFGAAGAIAKHYGASHLIASVVGLGCGTILATLMCLVMNLFYRQQASSIVATDSAVGSVGTVAVSIGEGALGEVSLCLNGQYLTYTAAAKDGGAIPKGQTVRVVRTLGSQLIVEKEA